MFIFIIPYLAWMVGLPEGMVRGYNEIAPRTPVVMLLKGVIIY